MHRNYIRILVLTTLSVLLRIGFDVCFRRGRSFSNTLIQKSSIGAPALFTIFIMTEPGGTASEVIQLKTTRKITSVINLEVKLNPCLYSIFVTALIKTSRLVDGQIPSCLWCRRLLPIVCRSALKYKIWRYVKCWVRILLPFEIFPKHRSRTSEIWN